MGRRGTSSCFKGCEKVSHTKVCFADVLCPTGNVIRVSLLGPVLLGGSVQSNVWNFGLETDDV
jgi:hypothetical protein